MKKLTYEQVKNNIQNNNDKLLSTKYINCRQKLSIQCHMNHIYEITYTNYKSGWRCPECRKIKLSNNCKHKYTKKQITEIFKNENYNILNINEYKNVNSTIEFICNNNHTHEIKAYSFIQGHRCKYCNSENKKGNNNPNWNDDRTKSRRIDFLRFDLRKRFILKNDPLYNEYLNNKDLYEIDHIYPRKAFIDNELDKQYDINIIKEICNSVDNLQILDKIENRKKSHKYNQIDFINWFNNKIKEFKQKNYPEN